MPLSQLTQYYTVLHLCIHGILYSPLTTACYVQFLRFPALRPPPSALRLCNQTTLRPQSCSSPPNLTKWICWRLALRTGLLNVSYVRQDCTPGSVNLPVILYIRQPWFLIHSVLGEISAMPSKPGCLFALTLCIWQVCFPLALTL